MKTIFYNSAFFIYKANDDVDDDEDVEDIEDDLEKLKKIFCPYKSWIISKSYVLQASNNEATAITHLPS